MTNYIPKLEKFCGGSQNAEVWFKKLGLLAELGKWTNERKCMQLCFHLDKSASIWFAALDDTIQKNWDLLKAEFEKHFIKNISAGSCS